jgi:hypothetical protein
LNIFKNVSDLGIRDYLNKDASEIDQNDLMRTAGKMNKISADIGNSIVQFSLYTSALALALGMGYDAYKNNNEVNSLVNSVVSGVTKANDFLKRNLNVDLTTQTLTFASNEFGTITTKFGGAVSNENVSLTADNSFGFRFNSSVSLSAQFGLGVNVPLGPGSLKPNFRDIAPCNMGLQMYLSLTF